MTSRFWLRPRWVVGHVLCLFLIVLFVNLGFWQLRRLDEKRDRNALIHSRERATPTSVSNALDGGPAGAEYRRVRVRGTWQAEETMLVRSRSLNGQSGYHVITPLRELAGDGAVVVDRGFTPAGGGGEAAILDVVRPTDAGPVEVEGILRASEHRGRFGPTDPPGHHLVINRIDLERLQEHDPLLAPVYLQLRSSDPPPGDYPIPLPLPATDEGPHFGYAMQWFIFATVGAVGWPLLLRKTGRELRDPVEGHDSA